nr:hypothetical protein [Streptomyces sabulosicollis]
MPRDHAVPFTADDLPQYAVRLYETAIERPELVRLAAWAKLEGVVTADLVTESSAVTVKLQAIAGAQRAGRVTASMDPQDVLALVLAMALTWSPVGLSATAAPRRPARGPHPPQAGSGPGGVGRLPRKR